MTLTPTAVERLRDLLDDPEPKLIRVGVKNKGCSGSAYHLEYVDKPGKFDEQVEQDGVKVLIDSKALMSILGSEMDWVEDKLSSRFTFKNPNISESFPDWECRKEMLTCYSGAMWMWRIVYSLMIPSFYSEEAYSMTRAFGNINLNRRRSLRISSCLAPIHFYPATRKHQVQSPKPEHQP